MGFVREDSAADRIATELHLTAEQVRVALDYIAVHSANLRAADLRGAPLNWADLSGAIFTPTALSRTLLDRTTGLPPELQAYQVYQTSAHYSG
jgi:hypothetical protein